MLAHKLTGLFVAAAILLQGCAAPVRKDAVPESLTAEAQVPGLADVRYRIGVDNEAFAREGIDSVRREQAYLKAVGYRGPLPPSELLAISGGGDNGAFGAGLLNGWSAAGDRPTFKLVTGVSTGALIAPFAFLGPKYDDALKEFYTNISPEDVLERRSLIAAVTDDALADNRPLWNRVEQEVDQAFLDEIAAEWAQVDRRTFSIAGRAITSLIHTQGIGDLYRIYVTTQRDGFDFHLAYIPASFDAPHEEEFDTEFMRALFKLGYDMAVQGYPWHKVPPGYDG